MMIGTTIGIPSMGANEPRLALHTNRRTAPAIARPTTLAIETATGTVSEPLERRRASLRNVSTENPTTETTTTTMPTTLDRLPYEMSSSVWLEIEMLPAWPLKYVILSKTPVSPNRNASDTMNDGIRSWITSRPISIPTTPEASRPRMIATHQGKLYGGAASSAMIAPAMPALYPTDRSISPSRSTQISAKPRTMIAAAWVSRFARFWLERNSESLNWKYATRSTRPTRTGSTPLSPVRIFCQTWRK